MKNKLDTEERIVQVALEMFNKVGIEYVGMRELAAALDMRIGNLTYYFPTKDELVNRLSLNLTEENNKTIVPMEEVTMKGFFEMLRRVFENQLKYRCLMLSFVHLMERNPLVSKRYAKVQTKRNETWLNNVLALKKGKYLAIEGQEEVEFLVSTTALIARFWISEAAVSFKGLDEMVQLNHYLKLLARVYLPYATAKGRKELEELLE